MTGSAEKTQVYPKASRERDMHLDRPWRLDCNLVYGGESGGWCEEWSKGYRTRWGARIAAWWHYNIASWGGSVVLSESRYPPASSEVRDA